jgi:gamma-glutamyltranspeptidase/glutathione hydrolase
MTLGDILNPAIRLAEEGFPIHGTAAMFWEKGAYQLTAENNPHGGAMLLNGKPPRVGEIMTMPDLAETFKVNIDELKVKTGREYL